MIQLAGILACHDPFGEGRPINKDAILSGLALLIRHKQAKSNYEGFLAELQQLGRQPGSTQSDRDSYHYLFCRFRDLIYRILCLYQSISYEVLYERAKTWFGQLGNLLNEQETWVFTLNHDLYVECLALDLNIPITYGASGTLTFPVTNLDLAKKIEFSCTAQSDIRIQNPAFFQARRGINLVKVHGGLSEFKYRDEVLVCNLKLDKTNSSQLVAGFTSLGKMAYFYNGRQAPGGMDKSISDNNGRLDIIQMAMLTGGKKFSETSKVKAGEEKLQLLDDVLRQTDELTVIGYGFGDAHVNFRISNALVLNPHLSVMIINPASNQTPQCVKQFDYDGRIKKAYCGAAHWINYCRDRKWDAELTQALKDNAETRADIRLRVNVQLRLV